MMGFGTAIKTCMRKYVKFSGRAPRAEYWWFILFTSILGAICDAINVTLGGLVSLIFLLPTLAVGWRRMHDIGKSGLWNLLPILGAIFLLPGILLEMEYLVYAGAAILLGAFLYVLYLTIKRGDVGANEYGADPYGMGSDPTVFD